MTGAKTYISVGIFTLAILGIIAWGFMKLGDFLNERPGCVIYATFDNVVGVNTETPVLVAGIEIGQVESMELGSRGGAKLGLYIYEPYMVEVDATASIRTKGLLGSSYISIDPGLEASAKVGCGKELIRTETPVSLEKLTSKLGEVAEDISQVSASLAEVMGSDEGRQSLRSIIQNIESLTARLDQTVENNQDDLRGTIRNLNEFTASLNERTPQITEQLAVLIDRLNSLVEDNRENLGETLERIAQASATLNSTLEEINGIAWKVNEGEGTIGRLVNDDNTVEKLDSALEGVNDFLGQAERLHTYIDYRTEYLSRSEEFKHFINFRLQPRPDSYYLFGLVDNPEGVRQESTTVTTRSNEQPIPDNPFYPEEVVTEEETVHYEQGLAFSVQLAKRFYNVTLRAGIIESYGGVGMDLVLLEDRLQLGFDAYDFGRPTNPNLKAYANFWLWKYILVTAGADDIINDSDHPNWFIGAGLFFEDEDLKYLFSSLPLGSLGN